MIETEVQGRERGKGWEGREKDKKEEGVGERMRRGKRERKGGREGEGERCEVYCVQK
jgi:hypothetical protein